MSVVSTEQFLLKNPITGTTVLFFDTLLQDTGTTTYPAYLTFDNNNNPKDLISYDGKELWKLNSDNINVPFNTATTKHLTGRAFSNVSESLLGQTEQDRIREKFVASMASLSNNRSKSFVFFKNELVDDYFTDVKLSRTYETLDTLSIHNNLLNSIPVQEAQTGVVFGKLEAIQKIADEGGNRIKIPLRNVPIGIFNPSELFPASTTLDDNGNRIILNLTEASKREDYFNLESFTADTTNFLTSGSGFTSVPSQYKFITTTNDNGEYVIYDAPLGSQVIIFEVDLLKQGLTKDEVALNFFPYPPKEVSNVDLIPHFFFRQIPTDVLPAWGDSQSGYTEVNITAELDLRKWATYFIPPIIVVNQTLDRVQLGGNFVPLSVEFRDMSKDGFPIKETEVVELHNIEERDRSQQLLWNDEFVQLKKKAEFRNDGFHAFKLPANIYDPIGFKTDTNGDPINDVNQRGVWLCGYQFKMYYNKPKDVFRTTGFMRFGVNVDPNSVNSRDHFHMNRGNNDISKKNIDTFEDSKGIFPYDKKWSSTYPEPYQIPARPRIKNSEINIDSATDNAGRPDPIYQARYKDGDQTGSIMIKEDNSGGFGVQYNASEINEWQRNEFASQVNKGFVYKYERDIYEGEKYSTGYQPLMDTERQSTVLNGEKYQRVEGGYGYWMKPDGWPRIESNDWGDGIHYQDIINQTINESDHIFSFSVKKLVDNDIKLIMDTSSALKEGSLDIFRIVRANDLSLIERPPIGRFVVLNFQNIFVQNNTSTFDSQMKIGSDNDQFGYANANNIFISITNQGEIEINVDGLKSSIKPGDTIELNKSDLPAIASQTNFQLKLPANSELDEIENSYKKAKYAISMASTGVGELVNRFVTITPFDSIAGDNTVTISQLYLTTVLQTVNGYDFNQDFDFVYVKGAVFERADESHLVEAGFTRNQLGHRGDNNGLLWQDINENQKNNLISYYPTAGIVPTGKEGVIL